MWPGVDQSEKAQTNNINRLNEENDMHDLFVSHLKTMFQLNSLYRSVVECRRKIISSCEMLWAWGIRTMSVTV